MPLKTVLRTFVVLAVLSLGRLSLIQAQEGPTSGYVEVNGVQIHYRTFGEGPPMLLVHGFTNAGQIWDPFVDPLSVGHSVIVPDLRGHGLSTNPRGEFTHRLAALDLLGLIDELGIESVVGVGHSSGAIALLDLALIAPERLNAMVLVDGAHRFPDETRDQLAAIDAERMVADLPNFFQAVLQWHPGGMDQLRGLAEQVRSFAEDPEEGAHDPGELREVEVPTLIVHGD